MPKLKQTTSIMVNESDMSFQSDNSPRIKQKQDSYNHCKVISRTSSLEDKYGIAKPENCSELNNSIALKHVFSNNSKFLESTHQRSPIEMVSPKLKMFNQRRKSYI